MNQQINLYHPIFRKEEKKFSAATMLQAGVVVFAGIVMMYGYVWWRTHALRGQQQEVNAQYVTALARLNEVSAKLPMRRSDPRLEQEVRDLERRIEAIQMIRTVARRDLFKGSAGYSDILVALARQSNAGLWITGLTISGGGESVVLAGRTHAPGRIPPPPPGRRSRRAPRPRRASPPRRREPAMRARARPARSCGGC